MNALPAWLGILINICATALFLVVQPVVRRWNRVARVAGLLIAALLLNVIESAVWAFLGIDNYVRRPAPFVLASAIYLTMSLLAAVYMRGCG